MISNKIQNALHISYLSTALLSIDHINNRNGSIIPFLGSDQFEKCDVSITQIIVSNGGSLSDWLNPSDIEYDELEIKDMYLPGYFTNNCSTPIAAIGPVHASDSSDEIASSAASGFQIPHISLNADVVYDSFFNDYSVKFIGYYEQSADSLLEYLQQVVYRDYIILLHPEERSRSSFVNRILSKSKTDLFQLTVQPVSFSSDKHYFEESLKLALEDISRSKFTTLVLIPSMNMNYSIFTDLVRDSGLDMDTYFWIVIDEPMGMFCQSTLHLM